MKTHLWQWKPTEAYAKYWGEHNQLSDVVFDISFGHNLILYCWNNTSDVEGGESRLVGVFSTKRRETKEKAFAENAAKKTWKHQDVHEQGAPGLQSYSMNCKESSQ